MPCPYANIFGVPREGFHSLRLFGFAFNDVMGTLALAGITSYTTKLTFLRSTILWFSLAEVLHYAFGVQTQFLEQFNIVPDCQQESQENVNE